MIIGYYPDWVDGFVKQSMDKLKLDGQRKKAEAKLWIDIQTLPRGWPRPQGVTVRILKGYEPLWELNREKIWLLHVIEKKSQKTVLGDLNVAYERMQNILTAKASKI